MSSIEPNQRVIIGYSISNQDARKEWVDLIEGIAAWISEHDLKHEVIFHGTSTVRMKEIMRFGMAPTDISHATIPQSDDRNGSFWGDVHTAAAYADDTCKYRNPGSRPCLLMTFAEDLARDYDLYPDLATLDGPLKGLTKLDDPDVRSKWDNRYNADEWNVGQHLPWEESLDDLGAIIAAHEDYINPDDIFVIRSIEAFKALTAFAIQSDTDDNHQPAGLRI